MDGWKKVSTGVYVNAGYTIASLVNGPFSGLWCLSRDDEILLRSSKKQCEEFARKLIDTNANKSLPAIC